MVENRLYLGTANLGMLYGIANSKPVSKEEALRVLTWSKEKIDFIDYAPDYLNSDELLRQFSNSFSVTTKVNFDALQTGQALHEHLSYQLQTLGIARFHHILVRYPTKSKGNFSELWKTLEELRDAGICSKIGFSVYNPNDVLEVIDIYEGVQVFQVPENLLDRRFSKFMHAYSSSLQHIEFVVRSIFLQGLLLMPEAEIPSHLVSITPYLRRVRQEAIKQDCSMVQLATSYVKQLHWSSGTIVGANSLQQLIEIHGAFHENSNTSFDFLSRIESASIQIVDPRLWKKA